MNITKAAIVTGSSRGIGRGIALKLAEHGWHIVINYNTNRAAAETVRQEVEMVGASASVMQADLGDLENHDRLVSDTLDKVGRIDLLVNNAGVAPKERTDILKVSADSYDRVMSINLKGPFFLTQCVAIKMVKLLREGVIQNPKIINISSISAYTSSPSRGEYCLSKAGMGMMTALWADRLAEYGINVYEIRPGIIETDMTAGGKAKYNQLIFDKDLTPIHRWGKPEDVGMAVAAIAEGMLPFSTGEVINVDGGFHLRRL
jgi:NAD(P)-dependent dehydrogenase (short-subunit alcohol dehydrogenase family)